MKPFDDKQLHGWDDEKIYFTPKEGGAELCVSDEPALLKKLCVICGQYYRASARRRKEGQRKRLGK